MNVHLILRRPPVTSEAWRSMHPPSELLGPLGMEIPRQETKYALFLGTNSDCPVTEINLSLRGNSHGHGELATRACTTLHGSQTCDGET